jgi:hypothetical protein
MKKIFRNSLMCTALLMLCGIAAPTFAQGGGGGRMMQTPDQRVATLTTALTLTADQQAKVKAIYEADVKPMADARANQDRETMMKIRTDENAKIKALLTADQAAKFDAMPQGRGRMGGGGGGGNQ